MTKHGGDSVYPAMSRSTLYLRSILVFTLGAWLLPAPPAWAADAAKSAPRFYPDDPISRMPDPLPVPDAKPRKLSDYYDFFNNLFGHPGEKQRPGRPMPAQAVNTLGEVPDNDWYTNRHWKRRMSIAELQAGPGNQSAPSTQGTWTVVAAKTEGVTPGFTIRDAQGRRYVVKFDPLQFPEIATSADVVSSKFLYALGYHVPENYIIHFDPSQLEVSPEATITDAQGKKRGMSQRDLVEILLRVPREDDGRIRASASLYLTGKPLREFRFHGTRADDPNDIVPHEHRRDLRGYSVFCAWLGHDDSRAINTGDFLVTENGIPRVKHYLIDFGSTLGSASYGPNSPRSGFEYVFAWKPAALQFATLGLAAPAWARAQYPNYTGVGRFESKKFDAERWVPEYPNPAFQNRLPDDAYWAARQVMHFTDEEIRAIVATGEYSDPRAAEWVTQCLIERRDKIGRAFLSKVLLVDRFRIEGQRLAFDDLGVMHKLHSPRQYQVEWSRFDNASGQRTVLPAERGLSLPPQASAARPGEYFAAEIHAGDPKLAVTVYVRQTQSSFEIVGLDRKW
jgi:hypothetical protein